MITDILEYVEHPKKAEVPPKYMINLGNSILEFIDVTTFQEGLEKLIIILESLEDKQLDLLRYGIYPNREASEPKVILKGTSKWVEIKVHPNQKKNRTNALRTIMMFLNQHAHPEILKKAHISFTLR